MGCSLYLTTDTASQLVLTTAHEVGATVLPVLQLRNQDSETKNSLRSCQWPVTAPGWSPALPDSDAKHSGRCLVQRQLGREDSPIRMAPPCPHIPGEETGNSFTHGQCASVMGPRPAAPIPYSILPSDVAEHSPLPSFPSCACYFSKLRSVLP